MGRCFSTSAAQVSPRVAGQSARSIKIAPLVLVLLAGALFCEVAPAQDRNFIRGDTNADGDVNVSDALAIFNSLFTSAGPVGCDDSADSNDDGAVDISDGLYTLLFLFADGPPPPAPGHEECGPDPTADAIGCLAYELDGCEQVEVDVSEAGHLLNRIAYGPTQAELDEIDRVGIDAYIAEQLAPESIDESANTALTSREEALFTEYQPAVDVPIVASSSLWRYFKGTTAPPADWAQPSFDDSAWLSGLASFGYGDGDDLTPFPDMEDSFLTCFIRTEFTVDPADVDRLMLSIDYDDGFVAYLNGTEVLRRNVSGSATYNRSASQGHEAEGAETFDITARKNLLVDGVNVLAVSGHNVNLGSSDFTLNPALLNRASLDVPPITTIDGIESLQELIHVRGVYSRRQLQSVLADFWENHFCTDYEKIVEYFDELQNSDATDAMDLAQAEREAAQLEYLEYQFFYENGLGNFGDLLLYSATSPTMLIYLDNVLNLKRDANENYSREVLELYAMGVDNRYTQRDIEELAEAFTGWTVCKVTPGDVQSFPESARNAPVECGVQFDDTQFLGIGSGWKYLKGTEEPTPDQNGAATTAWAMPDFDDSTWTDGRTGIGYGDSDDQTVLSDMRNGYLSVYLRRTFTVDDPGAFRNLILEVRYDDGFVCYLNGTEVARSETMEDAGFPPAFDEESDSHEASEGAEYFNLQRAINLLEPGENVLAIQVHNTDISSSDLTMRPRLLDREVLPGSVENGDPSGIWTFRFNADEHNTGSKTLFNNTPYEINVPSGRTGAAGLQDALEVIDALVEHPSTAEFICIKLIQKFVSDDLTLTSYKNGTAPPELVGLLASAIAAWNSTTPKGNIETVLQAILAEESPFWAPDYFRAKVKTPLEFINSSLRALDGISSGNDLPDLNDEMGMHYFTRDEPDGWSESGLDWIDTGTMLSRIEFARELADNGDRDYTWDTDSFLAERGLTTAEAVVDYFSGLLYQGSLPATNRAQLIEFLNSDSSGNPLTFSLARTDAERRVRELVGLLLSLPLWNFQ